jgi:hypothetical protein
MEGDLIIIDTGRAFSCGMLRLWAMGLGAGGGGSRGVLPAMGDTVRCFIPDGETRPLLAFNGSGKRTVEGGGSMDMGRGRPAFGVMARRWATCTSGWDM